ncbi:MAG: BlaI/MecI/CopY family transcriptional regulator [Evtepia sp.]
MKDMSLSQAEQEIMELVWSAEKKWISIPALLEQFPQKQWKYTTIATFFTRLKKKGFLETRKDGSVNLYHPMISKEDYLNIKTQEFVSMVHEGSAKSLLATLYSEKLSEEDYEELLELIEKCEV